MRISIVHFLIFFLCGNEVHTSSVEFSEQYVCSCIYEFIEQIFWLSARFSAGSVYKAVREVLQSFGHTLFSFVLGVCTLLW